MQYERVEKKALDISVLLSHSFVVIGLIGLLGLAFALLGFTRIRNLEQDSRAIFAIMFGLLLILVVVSLHG